MPKYITGMDQPVYRLRHVPLKELTPQELALLIWEDAGLAYLMPLALEAVTMQPYDEQTCRPSRLLSAVLLVPRRFWTMSPELATRAASLARLVLAAMESRYVDHTLRDKSIAPDDWLTGLQVVKYWEVEYQKDQLRDFIEVIGGAP